jgi:archaellum component FlaF (FlaF/FlaG flagellin family)
MEMKGHNSNYTGDMYKLLISLLVLFSALNFIRCSNQHSVNSGNNEDNEVIEELYNKDIEIRELDAKTDTVILENYDKVHREQIFELLADGKVITPTDKIRSAWILQHTVAQFCDGTLTSMSPENFLLAYKLSSSALSQLELLSDTSQIRKLNATRIVALNYDRYLLYSAGYQKFGTQYVFDDETGEMLLAPINTNLSSDAERTRFNVDSLHVLQSKHKMKPMPQ